MSKENRADKVLNGIILYQPRDWASLGSVARFLEYAFQDVATDAATILFRSPEPRSYSNLRASFNHHLPLSRQANSIRFGARNAVLENRPGTFDSIDDIRERTTEALVSGALIQLFVSSARTLTFANHVARARTGHETRPKLAENANIFDAAIDSTRADATVHLFERSDWIIRSAKETFPDFRAPSLENVITITIEEVGMLPKPIEAQLRAAYNLKQTFEL